MKVPVGVDVYYRGRRLKAGADLPKELEETVRKAVGSTKQKSTKPAKPAVQEKAD